MIRFHSLSLGRFALASSVILLAAACGGGGSGGSGGPLTFAYLAPAPTYIVCGSVTPNTPVLGGLVPTAYSISPALPAGLVLDTNTGVISGAPTAASTVTTYQITATTPVGAATASVDIQVDLQPIAFEYANTNLLETVRGFTFADGAPAIQTGAPTSFAITAGTLPAGISFDTLTGVFSGRPLGNETQALTVEASDCTSATASVNVTLGVGLPATRGVYVANGADATVSSFLWESASGDLRSTGYGLPGLAACDFVAVHPGGAFVYAADTTISEIELFAADPVSGRLSAPGSSLGIAPAVIRGMAIDPTGANLYVATDAGAVLQLGIDAVTGVLTPLSPASVANVTNCASIAVSPHSDFVYVGDENTNVIAVFARNPLTGTLVLASAQSATVPPQVIEISPDGAHLYSASTGSANLNGFSIDGSTGALTATPWSPLTMANVGARAFEITGDGSYFYAASNAVAAILQYSVNAGTGALTPLGAPSVSLPAVCNDLVADPFSQYVYACLVDEPLAAFSVSGSSGELAPLPSPFVAVRPGATRIALQPAPTPAARTTSGLFVLSGDAPASLYSFSFDDATGALTNPDSVAVSTNTCWGLDCHPTLATLYVSDDNTPLASGTVDAYTIGANESLGVLGNYGTDTTVDALRFDPTGRFAYQSLWGSSTVRVYQHDESTGALLPSGTAGVQANPSTLAVDPTGALLAVPNDGSSSVTLLTIDRDDGSLSFVSNTTTAVSGATRAFFHPSGRFLYVTGESAGVLVAFAVDHQTPALSALGLQPCVPGDELVMGLSPNGRFVVTHDNTTGFLTTLAVDLDATNGTPDGTLTVSGAAVSTGFTNVHGLSFDAQGKWLLVVTRDGDLEVRTFSAGGVVGGTAVGTGTVAPGINFISTHAVLQ